MTASSITLYPPQDGSYNPFSVNGRIYLSTNNTGVNVPYFDAASLIANGWSSIPYTGVGSGNITFPLPISQGGTGSTTQSTSLAALGGVSTSALSAAISNLMPLTGGTFSGAIFAPTASNGTNNTQLATTQFVVSALQSVASGLYLGVWNASTNTPTITSTTANGLPAVNGNFYIVDVAGSTNINGFSTWAIGDQIWYGPTGWQRIANTQAVVSVNSLTGAVVISTSNLSGVGATGTALMNSANAAAAYSALNITAVGQSLITATSAAAALTALGALSNAAGSVANTNLANMAATTIKANLTTSSASPTDATPTQIANILPIFTSTNPGVVPASGGNSSNLFLSQAGTFITPPSTTTTTINQSSQIPGTYFGVDINNPDALGSAPLFYLGTGRMWDAFSNNNSGITIYWKDINTAAGVFNWTQLDDIVAVFKKLFTNIIFTFGYVPTFANNTNTSGLYPNPPTDLTSTGSPTFNAFVTALVTRYKGIITHYEMWNEPNGGYWGGTAQQLYYMLTPAYGIIKSIDGNAKVLSPGCSGTSTNVQYMEQLFSYGYGLYYDIYTQHMYPWWSVTENSITTAIPEFTTTIINYHNYVQKAYGYTNKQLWNTEFSNNPASTPTTDPVFLAVSYILGYSSGLSVNVWFGYDIAGSCTLDGGNTATLNNGGIAYKQIVSWLLNSVWLKPPSRQMNSNLIRNYAATGAVTGTPGTLPTYWGATTASNVTTTVVGFGPGYVDWQIVGTSAVTNGQQIVLFFEDTTRTIPGSPAANLQAWTFNVSLILQAGSLANQNISFVLAELPSYTYDVCQYGYVYPTSYNDGSNSNQIYTLYMPLTQSNTTGIRPGITINFTGGAVNMTLRIGNPTLDNGTQWYGDIISNGTQARIAWDQNGYTKTSTLASNYTQQQNIFGTITPIISGSVTLTNSPIFLYNAAASTTGPSPTTVSLLNTNYPASNYTPGTRASVTDSTLSLIEGLGQIVVGGGGIWTQVTADNAGNWRIG